MLPQLENNQQVFIEITNPTHGGAGWELGRRLWSPVFANDREGRQTRTRTWRIMERINVGDLIIHLVNTNDVYHFTGVSIAASTAQQTNIEPPLPDQWGHMAPYQFVELSSYIEFESHEPIPTFFKRFNKELTQISRESEEGQFYVLYGATAELRVAQRYLAPCPPSVYQLFSLAANAMGIDLAYDNVTPTNNEPAPLDQSPGRTFGSISRIIRDTALSRRIKSENGWRCQVCGLSILLPNGESYSEGHHIKPLGIRHNGPDVRENIIVLCPNHHAEFDYASIAINPETLKVHHIDSSNQYHNKELAYSRTDIRKDFLEYHYSLFLNNLIPTSTYQEI